MINGGLLALKYKSVFLTSKYSAKDIVSLGWKCRKYQNWGDVQDEDYKVELRAFGDAAVDAKEIDHSILPTINAVLLKVQRWRLDKTNFSIEPEHLENWGHANILLKIFFDNPMAAVDFLSRQYGLPANYDVSRIYDHIGTHLILLIIGEALGQELKINLSDLDMPLMDVLSKVIKETNIPDELLLFTSSSSVADSLAAIDLPAKRFTVSESDYLNWEPSSTVEGSYAENALSGKATAKLSSVKGNKVLTFNTNNSGFIFAKGTPKTEQLFKAMVDTNISAMEDYGIDPDVIADLQETWGMKINQLFLNKVT